MARRTQVVAVVIKQYGSGLYRTCISLDKNNITCLGTHQDETSATEAINRFWEAYDEGKLKTPDDVAIFINSFQSPGVFPPPPAAPAMAQQIFQLAA